jgi:hypothetical protein
MLLLNLDLPLELIPNNHQLVIVLAELAEKVLRKLVEYVGANLGCKLALDCLLRMRDDLLLDIRDKRDARSLRLGHRLVHLHGHT